MRRRVAMGAAALALGLAAGPRARGGAVTFTGNVEADMPVKAGNGVVEVPGIQTDQIAQSSWITQSGWTTGWAVKDIRLDYNKATDTMQVGVNFYSIAGDTSGNPVGSDPRVARSGGYDPANLGGRKSISVEFAANNPNNPASVGPPVIVAGVPENKTMIAGTGTDQFTVASAGTSPSLPNNYIKQINSAMGKLAFDPSAAHPDFEFTVKDWSQFASLAGPGGFWVSGYAGSPDDVVAGESKVPWVHVSIPQQQQVPEPSAALAWAALAGGAAWALRRVRRASDRT